MCFIPKKQEEANRKLRSPDYHRLSLTSQKVPFLQYKLYFMHIKTMNVVFSHNCESTEEKQIKFNTFVLKGHNRSVQRF